MGRTRAKLDTALAAPGGVKPESTQMKSLRGRLASNVLTPEDERRIGHTQAVLEGRRSGKSLKAIAAELGENSATFAQFVRGGIYRVLAEHLQALEVSEDEGVADEAVKRTRTSLKSMSPHVQEYVAWAARKRVDGKGYEDEGAAMWAAQYLGKATGVDTAQHAQRPSINIHIDTITTTTGAIKSDLNAAMRAAGAVIDATAEVVTDALEMENGA